jgi:hypothetical protein
MDQSSATTGELGYVPPGSPPRRKTGWVELETLVDAIRALGELYDNADSAREAAALTAARQQRPAYWTSARYHNQAALLVAQFANERGVQAALRLWSDDHYPSPARHSSYLVSTLIPLNAAASSELHETIASAMAKAAA